MTVTIDGTFSQRLELRLKKAQETDVSHLISSKAQSFEDYKSRCAVIRAYNNVLAWMDEIETEINRGD